jgi:poly(hydroxyalkanoate) depolymerase family esterase
LHGCLQTALQAAAATRFNLLADQLGFAVVYPEQAVTPGSSAPLADGNGSGCWNWFLPEDQQRDQGEPATIAGITKGVILSQGIDPSRVYVEGVSAGADMAVVLGATYPDLYAAVAPLAGCAYATCSDTTGSLAYQAMGTRARVVPMFVAQGTADTVNAFPLGQGMVDAWLGTDDWADNGKADGSVPRTPASVEHHGFDQTPQPGSGDPCVRASNWPCPGGVAGFQHTYPYTVEHFADANRCDVVDFWVIHGMEHALPSGPPDQPWTDPLGPDLTAASYRFFSQYTAKSGCPPT